MFKKIIQLALTLTIILHPAWLYYHLDVGEAPEVADVIIVPEGALERGRKAGDLYARGYSGSGKVIVSPLIDDGVNLTAHYVKSGIPETAIIPDFQATSTWTNAERTLKMMEEEGFDSALVVTSDYHSRRVRLSFDRVNRKYGFELTYISAYPIENGEEIPYRQQPINRGLALEEIYKYYGYLLGFYHYIDM